MINIMHSSMLVEGFFMHFPHWYYIKYFAPPGLRVWGFTHRDKTLCFDIMPFQGFFKNPFHHASDFAGYLSINSVMFKFFCLDNQVVTSDNYITN